MEDIVQLADVYFSSAGPCVPDGGIFSIAPCRGVLVKGPSASWFSPYPEGFPAAGRRRR